jgi:bacterioferritin-associated ferredoxin
MIVCLCQGVSERGVQTAIRGGACTRKEVTNSCGAGAGCGGCHGSIRELLTEAKSEERRELAKVENAQSRDDKGTHPLAGILFPALA